MWTVRSPMMVFPVIAAGLGTWQIYRWDRKQTMLAHREARRVAPVQALPAEMADVAAEEFKHFEAQGRFDHQREMVVSPRSYEGEAGFYVVTPLVRAAGPAVLVNRGWVPRRETRWSRPDGVVTVVGVVRQTEHPQSFTPHNTADEWFWMDVPAMAQRVAGAANVPVEQRYRLDAVKGRREDEPPIGGQTVFWMPNNHLTYIATWYSLAGALTAMIVMARKGKLK